MDRHIRQGGHNNNKRMRGRNRKGPNPLSRSYESNGPDVKVRGTAIHIAEKYSQLARDAQSSGDPIAAENYLQHAEHYYRIIATAQAQMQPQQSQDQNGQGDYAYGNGRDGRDRDSRDDEDGEDEVVSHGHRSGNGATASAPEASSSSGGAPSEAASGEEEAPRPRARRTRRPRNSAAADASADSAPSRESAGAPNEAEPVTQ